MKSGNNGKVLKVLLKIALAVIEIMTNNRKEEK